ncbi:MAG: FtsX-like permease family protein [Deltaproteobacteria bacterium]|nr:FtsX-like permease family protein [Deltaproteobacteria bacterium]
MKASLLSFALRALVRRKARSLALGGGLAFAVALVAAVLFMTEALRAEAERAHAAQPDIVVQKLVGGRPSTLSTADAAKLADIASVKSVTPRVWGYVFLPSLQGNVTVVGTAPNASPLSVANGVLASGRDITRGAHEMIAGQELAHFLGMIPGDELGLPTSNPDAHALKLVGTFRSSLDLFTADVVICDEEDARALLALPAGDATDFAVALANPAEARVVARTITERIPGARVIERDLLARVYHLSYGRRAGFVLGAAIPAILALLVLAWDRASGIGPDERKEIAVLKAVGWSTAEVLWAKLFESLLVGASATAIGLLLGYGWVFWLDAPGLRPALVGWSVLYPRAALTPAVDVAQLLGITLAVLGPFALLSVVPAWRAASADPLDTMRT